MLALVFKVQKYVAFPSFHFSLDRKPGAFWGVIYTNLECHILFVALYWAAKQTLNIV